jgi:hypothetical protein
MVDTAWEERRGSSAGKMVLGIRGWFIFKAWPAGENDD